MGFVVVYSTTRPVSCAEQTRFWLGENGFAPGRALLHRVGGDHRAAVEVKAGHCRAVGSWLSAFVDDESETVEVLRSGGMRAHSFEVLSGLGVRKLRATLTTWTPGTPTGRGMHRPRGHGRRGAPHRRRARCTGSELRCVPPVFGGALLRRTYPRNPAGSSRGRRSVGRPRSCPCPIHRGGTMAESCRGRGSGCGRAPTGSGGRRRVGSVVWSTITPPKRVRAGRYPDLDGGSCGGWVLSKGCVLVSGLP